MKIEIKRDPYHSWLVLSEGKSLNRDDYRVHMITENEIRTFLHCRIREMDGMLQFCYDITGRVSLKSIIDSTGINRNLLEGLLADLSSAFSCLNEYLLDQNGLQLSPEQIYLDKDRAHFRFVYCPAGDGEFKDSLRELGEGILPGLDHKDRAAVVMGYSFYQRCVEGIADSYSLLELPELSAGFSGEEEDEEENTACSEEDEIDRDTVVERKFDKKSERRDARGAKRRGGRRSVDKEERRNIRKERRPVFFRIISEFLDKRREKRKEEKERKRERKRNARSAWQEADPAEAFLKEMKAIDSCIEERNSETDHPASWKTEPEKVFDGDAETVFLGKGTIPEVERKERARLVPLLKESGSKEIRESGGQAILLYNDSYVVGKNTAAAQIVLESRAVSRVHARLLWDGVTYRLTDLNSRNGTEVNGKSVGDDKMVALEHEDHILFADLAFTYLQG